MRVGFIFLICGQQHNGQKKKGKRTNNDLQNITHKTKDRLLRTPLKTGVNPGAPEELAVPVPLVNIIDVKWYHTSLYGTMVWLLSYRIVVKIVKKMSFIWQMVEKFPPL